MKIIMMLLGNLLMGIAVAILRMSRFGTDPFTCMNLGVSGFLNISFGTYQLLVNIILFIFVLWKGRGCIGAGTIVNMAGIGYIADFGVFVLTKCLGQPEMLSMQIRILLMIFAVTMCSFAAAMYMEADMGIAPYDSVAIIIEKLTHQKIPFHKARVLSDVVVVIVGIAFASASGAGIWAVAGIGTVINACFNGPLIQFFKTKLEKM